MQRFRVASVIALTVLCALTACVQAPTTTANPRLRSIAGAVEPTPTTTATTPQPTETAPPADQTQQYQIAPAPPPCPEGPYQGEVEAALARIGSYGAITIDGRQSVRDCQTIIAFQQRMGIEPAEGAPGPTTLDVATRIASTDVTQCPVSDAAVACVDLTHQTFYIARAGKVLVGPTVTRTGMPGWATPSGDFPIANRSTSEWSVPFSVWLPYWQRFYLGDGLHETTTYIHNMANGSHGCVNLLHADAIAAYSLLGVGSIVHLYGRRPGT